MDSQTALEPFLLLAKATRGRAAADLVQKVTSEPGIYAFGELLDISGFKELEGSDLDAAYKLLLLFCYGTWSEHKGRIPRLELNKQQQQKLKQLTVVTLAGSAKRNLLQRIPYPELMSALEIQSMRELEDFLISDCFYPGLVAGKLDQLGSCLHIEESIARDVRPEEFQYILAGLRTWPPAKFPDSLQSLVARAQALSHDAVCNLKRRIQKSEEALAQLEGRAEYLNTEWTSIQKQQEEMESKLQEAKAAVKAAEAEKEGCLVDSPMAQEALETEDRTIPLSGSRPKRRR